MPYQSKADSPQFGHVTYGTFMNNMNPPGTNKRLRRMRLGVQQQQRAELSLEHVGRHVPHVFL